MTEASKSLLPEVCFVLKTAGNSHALISVVAYHVLGDWAWEPLGFCVHLGQSGRKPGSSLVIQPVTDALCSAVPSVLLGPAARLSPGNLERGRAPRPFPHLLIHNSGARVQEPVLELVLQGVWLDTKVWETLLYSSSFLSIDSQFISFSFGRDAWHGDLSSLTKDATHVPCLGSVES